MGPALGFIVNLNSVKRPWTAVKPGRNNPTSSEHTSAPASRREGGADVPSAQPPVETGAIEISKPARVAAELTSVLKAIEVTLKEPGLARRIKVLRQLQLQTETCSCFVTGFTFWRRERKLVQNSLATEGDQWIRRTARAAAVPDTLRGLWTSAVSLRALHLSA